MDEGQEFLFGVLPRSPRDKDDSEQASEWLSEALAAMGAGAKTSSGYGRFSKVELKNKGMRWLALISRKNEKNVTDFLRSSPKVAREEWIKIEDPKIKSQAANAIKRIYQDLKSWDHATGERKKFKTALEEHFTEIGSSMEGLE